VRCTAASIGSAETQRDATPTFSPHRSAVLGVYVVVVARLAQRTERYSSATVLRWRRHGIALIWKYRSRGRWRGGRPRIALETRQLIREMARANFLWGAPRIHGELLKLGITVSQATVSRYMPTSRKDRRSQAWRTFIRNHAVTILQSRSFNEHSWTRDLLSQVPSRSRVFTYRLSAFVISPVTVASRWAVWHAVHPLFAAATRRRVRSIRIVTLTAKSTTVACRYPSAARQAGLLTTDRIRDPPTARELKRHANRSSVRSTGKRVSFTPSTRRHSTASSTIARIPKLQLAHRTEQSPPHPIGLHICGSRFEEPQRHKFA
jgi:hypothetical protein